MIRRPPVRPLGGWEAIAFASGAISGCWMAVVVFAILVVAGLKLLPVVLLVASLTDGARP
jgi:hypothetical protein